MNAQQALAPTGKLRAGMNIGNTLFTRQNESGELFGVSVDLMQELAKSLDVPLELLVYQQPGQVADDALNDKWDVAILAIEKTRAKTIIFSPGMTEIEALAAGVCMCAGSLSLSLLSLSSGSSRSPCFVERL